jgi:hypothetical protein
MIVIFSTIAIRHIETVIVTMTEEKREYKEKVKTEDDGGYKIESEAKDEFGNKVKEKHEVKVD